MQAQRVPRDQNESPKGAKWEPMGATWEPKGSKIGAQGSPRTKDRESEKRKITKSRKVENHENLKITKVEMLIFHSFYNEN